MNNEVTGRAAFDGCCDWAPTQPQPQTQPADKLMSMQAVKHALVAGLGDGRHQALFERAKTRQPALRRYASVAALLPVLFDESALRWHAKDTLTRAFLAEEHAAPHPLWNALLVLSAYPILVGLHARIQGDYIERDELAQVIVASFLEVAHTFPLSRQRNRTFMHLRQMTQRRVFRLLRARQHAAEVERSEEPVRLFQRGDVLRLVMEREALWPETKPPAEPPPVDIEIGVAQVSFLLQHAGHVLDGGNFELMIATLVRGERLRSFVNRIYADVPASERHRLFHRVKRRHARTMAELRDALGEFSQNSC